MDGIAELQGVVFDFDGVIVDSEHLHYEALNRVLDPMGMGFTWDFYVDNLIGFDDRGAFLAVHQIHRTPLSPQELQRLVDRKAATFRHMVTTEPPEPFPGVVDLIRKLAASIPLALCSGALRSDVDPVFRALGLTGVFRVIVTADDVHASKPDPTCYRLAVKRLGEVHGRVLDPSQCLAIEDTPAGITSAKGARLRVLALTNSYDREYLGMADAVLETLEGVDLARLQELFAACGGRR